MMYRRTGESKFDTPSEKKTAKFSSENNANSFKYNDCDKGVFIKSRTFQNSNWRQPPPSEKPIYFDDSTQGLTRKEVTAVNCLMPSFSSKKESNYKPTIKAVDNLTPKFLNMDLSDCVTPNFQKDQQGKNKGVLIGSSSKYNQNNDSSWRKPSSTMMPMTYFQRRFEKASELTDSEKKRLAQPESLLQMLGSKGSLYGSMNELNSKTLKVKGEDHSREEQACEHVKQETIHLYPNCNILPYSMRRLGLAFPESGLYMFFDTGTYFQASHANKERQTETRKTVFKILNSCGHCVNVLDWDKQEMVTFIHTESQLKCFVTFDNGFKERNTLLLQSYLTMDKRLRLLMLLVSDMVYRYHDISKYFTSYVNFVMVIMFLQRIPEPVLPSLQKLRESYHYEKVFIGGFDCGFPKDISFAPPTNHMSVEELLKGFCAYFRDYNFKENVISIQGPELKRSMFNSKQDIATSVEPLRSYLIALENDKTLPKINCDLPVMVQDPFELNCNVAEKITETTLEVFQMMCQDGYEILSKWC